MHLPASSPGILLEGGARLEQSGNFDPVPGLGASTVVTHGIGVRAVTTPQKQYRIVSARFQKGETAAPYVPSSADLTPQVSAGADGWVSAASLSAALQQVLSFSFTANGQPASFGGSGDSRGFNAVIEPSGTGTFSGSLGFEDWTDNDFNDAYLSYTVEVRATPSEDPQPECTCSCTCSPIQPGSGGESKVTAPSGLGIQYASGTANGNVVVKTTGRINPVQGVPDSVEVRLVFNGVPQPSVFLDPAGLVAGDSFTAAARADTTSLPTGRYPWSMALVSRYGATQLEETVAGQQDVVSRAASEFGSGWWLPELDRLDVTTAGVNLITGLNQAVWFSKSGGTYAVEAGNPSIASLAKNSDNSFTLTYTDGSRSAFSPAGVLSSRVDSTGNTRNYSYADQDGDGVADELVSITDETGRTANFTYTGGKVTQIEDFDGRTTSYTFAGALLSAVTEADPDGSGPLVSPVTSYSYNGSGLLTKVTDPLGGQSQVTYDFTGRVNSIQQACGGTTTLQAYATIGLPNIAVAGYDAAHLAAIVRQSDTVEQRTDEHGNLTRIVRDRFGNVLQTVDALGNSTTFSRDSNGLVTRVVQPDPDGAGPLSALVTQYSYDSRGNLTKRINPDATQELWTYDPLFSQPTSYTDPLGHKTLWSISPTNGLVLSMTRVVGAVDSAINHETNDVTTTYTYTAGTGGVPAGLVQTMTDALGRITSYAYTTHGLLQTMTRAVGTSDQTTMSFEYDASDNLTAVIDGLGRRTQYAYDNLHRLTSLTQADPDGTGPKTSPVWHFAYDANGNRTSMTDPLGNVTQYLYDVRGRLSGTIQPDPDGAGPQVAPTTSSTYDCVGNLVSIADALGRTTTYSYDALNRMVQAIQPDPDGAGALTAPTTHTTYNAVNWVTSTTDPLGNTTNYVYDAMGRVLSVTQADPDGAGPLTAPVTSYTYDAAGQMLTTTDPLGRITSYSYDDLGRVVSITKPDPDGAGPLTAPVTTYGYDKMGNRTSVIDPLGHVTLYGYDNLDRLVSVTEADPDGSGPLPSPVTTYVYDAASQLVSTTDPLGRFTTNEYDNLGRLTTTAQPDPDGSGPALAAWTVFTYDAVGNVLSESDRLGNTTSTAYDSLYRVIASTDANGGVTAFTYDAVGNRLSLTDPSGNTTSWTYDNLDRVIQDQNALGASRYFAYNAASNLVQKTDRDGRVTQYAYDNLQRQTSETWLVGSSVIKQFAFSYDAASQLLSAGDGTANNTYQYDSLGRVTQSAATISGLAQPVTMTQGYDAASRPTSLFAAIGSTADFKNLFAYDNLDRLTSVTQQGQTGGNSVAPKRVDFGYLADGQLTQMTRFANLAGTQAVASTAFGYDAAGRLSSLVHSKSATVFAGYGYGYDAGNRMTAFTNSAYPAEDATFANDATGQLTGADRTGSSSDEVYVYDATGNRVTANGSTYATGANNRLLNDGTNSYTYDAEGNITRITNTATGAYQDLTWDYRNRLTQVAGYDASATQQWSVTYVYDAFNRLVERTEYGGGATTPASNYFFAYDGYQMVLKLSASGNVESRTLWGNTTDQILATEDGSGNIVWPLADHLNTVRDLVSYQSTTDTTTLENHIVYDSFGKIVSETQPSVTSDFKFTARYTDARTGLQWNLNRWYLPTIGRWATEDPIGFAAGDPNLGRYVTNGPLTSADPTGLHSEPGEGILIDCMKFIEKMKDWFLDYLDVLKEELDKELKSPEFQKSIADAVIAIGDPKNIKWEDYQQEITQQVGIVATNMLTRASERALRKSVADPTAVVCLDFPEPAFPLMPPPPVEIDSRVKVVVNKTLWEQLKRVDPANPDREAIERAIRNGVTVTIDAEGTH
ncbi:MAG: RHS repeat protein [Betaproteobacteria bacterium]|nr:RHS repeat protein [Betaproteobacteria bacterium]